MLHRTTTPMSLLKKVLYRVLLDLSAFMLMKNDVFDATSIRAIRTENWFVLPSASDKTRFYLA
ncbi:hypothetical protein GCM10011498_36570 [Amylibacter cionae]|uniref:Uncharacterized protein n=1 Tax=Neptunicoccus cionae TaxID=2035344 RepID=A0A916R6M5_9RHOB|nr:hypothetical protein GCM10011498_36570 [Amylibacter cionae]